MPQYFETNPDTPSERKLIDYRANGINFEFITDSAVFSRNGVDFGTSRRENTGTRVFWTWDAAWE